MKIGITTIAYNQAKPLLKMVSTATNGSLVAGHIVEFHLFLHSPVKPVIEACETIRDNYRTVYYPYKHNRGVATSWNDGIISMMDRDCDVMMLVNDDVYFMDGDIEKIVNAAVGNRDRWAVFCAGWNDGNNAPSGDHGFSCIVLNPIAIGRVGMLDENFFPAYNEDLDYVYRAEKILGLQRFHLKDTAVHHIGSATIKANQLLRQQNHTTHGENDKYWERKWGAKKPNGKFMRPFNNANFTAYIDPKERHAPYPNYNRTDKGIVRL